MNAQTEVARGYASVLGFLFYVFGALAVLPAFSQAADTLETVQKSADEWVKLRVETARLEAAWQEERSLVESMVAALNERATTAEENRDLAKARTAKEREEDASLRARIDAGGGDLRGFEQRLLVLSAKLAGLRPALPPRLSDALEMSFRSLVNPSLPPGERMQITMTVLNRCVQFNRSITVGEEVLALEGVPNGKSLEAIYWGLSQGYAIDRAARKAWLGAPTADGWKWTPKTEAYDQIVRLIAVANDKADPGFVTVPAQIPRLVSAKPPH